MRAPVYRHVEGQSTIAGLSFNGFVAVLGIAFISIQAFGAGTSIAAILGTYLVLRLVGSGKPPMYWQHLAVWHLRARRTQGMFSSAARARVPRFPFGVSS